MMLCKNHVGVTLGILGGLFYIVCHFWGFVLPAEVQPLHTDLIRISVLGWSGMNATSFILGIIQWFAWGWIFGFSFMSVGKWCAKSCPLAKKK